MLIFCLYMCSKYDEAKERVALERAQFKQSFVAILEANRRKQVPYPSHLAELPSFVEWLPLATGEHVFADPDEEAIVRNMCRGPLGSVMSYKSCRAFGNHWRTMSLTRLKDCDGSNYSTFDSGMAGFFCIPRLTGEVRQ
jgi:hypothetical protein